MWQREQHVGPLLRAPVEPLHPLPPESPSCTAFRFDTTSQSLPGNIGRVLADDGLSFTSRAWSEVPRHQRPAEWEMHFLHGSGQQHSVHREVPLPCWKMYCSVINPRFRVRAREPHLHHPTLLGDREDVQHRGHLLPLAVLRSCIQPAGTCHQLQPTTNDSRRLS